MGIVFAVRGDSLVARYSTGGATASTFYSSSGPTPGVTADAAAIGGNAITFGANNNIKVVTWPGRFNTPNNRTCSVLVRISPGYNGTPAANRQLFSIGSGRSSGPVLELQHNTGGNLMLYGRNETGAVCFTVAAVSNYSAVSAAYTDFVFQFAGVTGTPGATLFTNATANNINVTQAFSSSWTNQLFNEIYLGTGFLNGICNGDKFNEMAIWDQTIDVTAVPLADGTTASLNGSSRTAFVNVSALDGMQWTTFNQTAVQNSFVFTAAGVGFTGSYVTVSTANVRSTATFGPANAYTGTLVVPIVGNVIAGVLTDNATGTYVTTAKTDVRLGTTFGAGSSQTGSLVTASATTGGGGTPGVGRENMY